MVMRFVLAPSAPSQTSEFGACPSVCFQGWKWSLTNTESKPTSSARREKSSNSRGPNCSAEALYPSFSTYRSFVFDSRFRQHVLAEALHVGEDFVGGVAVKAEIEIGHAKIAQCADIAGHRVVVAGEEAAVAVIGLLRDGLAALRHAIGEADRLWVAVGVLGALVQPVDAALKALQRIEAEFRVCADRIPGVAEPGGAAQGRAALAADPDGNALLHRARLKEDVREIGVLALEGRVFLGPQHAACRDRLVGDGAALL